MDMESLGILNEVKGSFVGEEQRARFAEAMWCEMNVMEFEHWRPLISNLIGILMLVVFLMFYAFQNALSAINFSVFKQFNFKLNIL